MCFEACHEIWRPFPPRPEGDFRLGAAGAGDGWRSTAGRLDTGEPTPVAGASTGFLRQVVWRGEGPEVEGLWESQRLSLRLVWYFVMLIIHIFHITFIFFFFPKCFFKILHFNVSRYHVNRLFPALVTLCCLGCSLSRIISARTVVDSVS